VALMVRPTLRDGQGRPVLPVFASDGYFSLLPGEARRLTIEAPRASDATQVTLDGWNTAGAALPVAASPAARPLAAR
jgi:hypothetical protein